MSNGPIALAVSPLAPNSTTTQELEENATSPTIHRSASHAQFEETATTKAPPARTSSIQRSFSENILTHTAGNISRKKSTKGGSEGSVKTQRSLRRLGSSKHRSSQQELGTNSTAPTFIVGADQSPEEIAHESAKSTDGRTPDREVKARSVSGSLSKFARKSWASASRSPSPSPNRRRSRREFDVVAEPDTGLPGSTEKAQESTSKTVKGPVNGVARRNSFLSKRPMRPLSSLLSKGPENPDTPSVPPIPKSFSTDKIPSLSHKSSNLSNPPAIPTSKSFERLHGKGVETPRKKDELWSVFRNLDGDYQKFQSRPGTLKTGLIRSALLPFLRSYAEHPSIASLRPEDLDRRVVILNKWWTGLLEMLNGRHGETVSGNDRPAVLEAATALMVRPEWTLPSRALTSRPMKNPPTSLKSRSTTSLVSTMTMSSDFLAESVYHNVKNTFTQNLLAQMAYVVDKMSMRSVAASVVAFCGKATAYAFFYCEGVAEILVRLWATPPATLRRVLAETGVQKDAMLDSVSDRICTLFPPCLQSLTFKSLPSMMRHLRSRPHVPIATAYIPWHGPWIGRWAGKDTDLFYVFAKFFTDLISRFFPEEPSIVERVAAPGWLLVQAQILSVLDATMQRANNQIPIEPAGPSPVTFDDMLGEADVNATVLPLPANSAVRSMAENRLILLLRDCLSGTTIMTERAQSIFAQSFSTVLKATARKTSVFDHNACFALCDFLEEALAILTRYHQASDAALNVIDWSFWLDVCKHMLQSQNSMTEVRLCAFLYAMWPTITSDEGRKREICLEWILTPAVFQAQFNHWCPMVRAFFMRLLAWRVGRPDSKTPELNKSILETLSERLQESWRHFLYLQEIVGRPSVAVPSAPAPGRRLLIVRNDVQPAPAGMFLSFDDILSSPSKVNPFEKHSSPDTQSVNGAGHPAKNPNGRSSSIDSGKKRWSLFRSIIPMSNSYRDVTRPSSSARPQITMNGHKSPAEKRLGPTAAYRILSFKFSLEWFDREGTPIGTERRLFPPKLPLLAHLALEEQQEKGLESSALKPEGAAIGPSKYAGRALAEWALLVLECKTFFERRKAEGVPTYQMVETPTLGVEPFRKV